MRLQCLCIQYWDYEVLLWVKFFKIMNFACISVWFGDESLHIKYEILDRTAFVFYCVVYLKLFTLAL